MTGKSVLECQFLTDSYLVRNWNFLLLGSDLKGQWVAVTNEFPLRFVLEKMQFSFGRIPLFNHSLCCSGFSQVSRTSDYGLTGFIGYGGLCKLLTFVFKLLSSC